MKSQIAFLFFSFLICVDSQASQLKGTWHNRQGIDSLKEERGSQAHDQFVQSLAEMPFSPEAHYNLGTSYLVNKDFEKAVKEFIQAAELAKKTQNKEIEFYSRFDAALAYTALKKIDAALDQYQKALEVEPESVEVKTNIELLTQQGGGGEGGDEKQQPKDGEGQQSQQQGQNQDKGEQRQQRQSKPFNSKEMSQQDVNRIVEELKRQEEQIRAKFQNEKIKSSPNEKDW